MEIDATENTVKDGDFKDVTVDYQGFISALTDLLVELENETNVTFQEYADKLRVLCTYNEQNYVLSQTLINRLTRERFQNKRTGYLLKKVVNELENMVGSDQQKVKAFNDAVCYSVGAPSPDLIQWITSIQNSKKPAAGDVIKKVTWNLSAVMPIKEVMLADLFGPNKTTSHFDEKIWLVAYAASVQEYPGGELDRSQFPLTIKALKDLHANLSRLTGATDLRDEFLLLLEAVKTPVTSVALMNWVSGLLSDPGFYETNLAMGETPPVFDLLDEMAIRRPLQRPQIFRVFVQNFERPYETMTPLQANEVRKKFLDRMIFMMKVGYVIPVTRYILKHGAEVDDSLTVYFLKTLLSMIEPPYPTELVGDLIKIIDRISSVDLIRSTSTDTSYKIISNFLESCADPLNELTDADRELPQTNFTASLKPIRSIHILTATARTSVTSFTNTHILQHHTPTPVSVHSSLRLGAALAPCYQMISSANVSTYLRTKVASKRLRKKYKRKNHKGAVA
ncbi:Negative elongation factor C/D, partial [Quaeritorhiza haematococci]